MRLVLPEDQTHDIRNRPRAFEHGEPLFALSEKDAAANTEPALIWSLIARRRHFGNIYRELQPDYFWEMSEPSGVFISALVPTHLVFPRAVQPGDIDLLIVPYERGRLFLSRVMAVEIKVIRASFAKPGKSPNDFGFSQARGLLRLGVPYVAVVHLIVSDQSPITHWRKYIACRIVGPNDEAEMLDEVVSDPLPMELTSRSFGRMVANCNDTSLGLVAQFMPNVADHAEGCYFPESRPARQNPHTDPIALSRVAAFFDRYWRHFVDTPRFDPKLGRAGRLRSRRTQAP